ncbi:uncharacterized protein KY384_005789 [Bacidia gigantensis]|uniref:uncharacterized protein n=1 Tax=Bacidia gigantensis TaxID=2732470 RepID=UPI001D041012|nr:uncharacterized protein KY384_005789 [Bacidia gigantensis]KAG8529154.1 hypothetical protein KY384_005789 [Bacidia gigantensis]
MKLIFLSAAIVSVTFAASDALKKSCCASLSNALSSETLYVQDQGYIESLKSYWTTQESALKPSCIVKPQSTDDVATAVKLLAKLDCSFAIRGNGHTAWAGSANIQDGVTIDLRSIDQIKVGSNGSPTQVGTGATWGDVYGTLDPLNLTVIGGRASLVGVSGLTLGGGISYLSPRYGFVCDNVENYEIVLASGKITNANANQNSDLFRALKGGSNNFGIVTRFDLRTVQLGQMWGGQVVYNVSLVPQALKAFTDFNAANPYDEYASTIQSVAFDSTFGLVAVNSFQYTAPVVNPPAFAGFDVIQPQLSSTLRITTLKDITDEQGAFSPAGFRDLYTTITFRNDLPFLTYVYNTWKSTVTSSITSIPNLNYAITWQPIPPAITSKSVPATSSNSYSNPNRDTGNSLGLENSKTPLILCSLSIKWERSTDDAVIESTARNFIEQIGKAAREKGVDNDFLYLNYALNGQDPIRGYGRENVERLKKASRQYDPNGVFQKQVPGGFKLPF